MNIDTEKAERLVEIAREMQDLLDEFKHICKVSMERSEYEQFKYRTLGHIEPALSKETEWYTKYSSLDSLEEVAEKAMDEVCEENIEDESEE